MPNILDLLNQGQKEVESKTTTEEFVKNNNVKKSFFEIEKEKELEKSNQEKQKEIEANKPTQEEMMAAAGNNALAEKYGTYNENKQNMFLDDDPETWTPYYTQMGFFEKTGNSLVRGIYKHWIGGTGDIIQASNYLLDLDVSKGNMISRWLQEKSKELEENHEVYIDESVRAENLDFSLESMSKKDFWSVHMAEMVPQLIEMIGLAYATGGAATALAASGTRNFFKGASKYGIRKGLLKNGVNVVENTTERLAKGVAKNLDEIPGTGKGIGKLITNRGELSKLGKDIVHDFGGAVAMNTLAGVQNGIELVNNQRDLAIQGEAIYSEDDYANMLASTFTNNLMYLPIDMLSFGLTYGKAGEKLMKTVKLGKNSNKVFTPTKQLKIASKSFAQRTGPVMNGLKKIGSFGMKNAPKTIWEGFEEQFQETFESWSAKKALSEVTNKDLGYDNSIEGFFDFFMSKENEATRAIAFGAGLMGGGFGNVMSYVNKAAEDNYKLYNRTEALKKRMNKNEDREIQIGHIYNTMVDNILDPEGMNNDAFIDLLTGNEVLNEEENEFFKNIHQEMLKDFDNAQKMNVKGKAIFLRNRGEIAMVKHMIKNENERFEIEKKSISEVQSQRENDNTNEMISNAEKNHEETIDKFNVELNQLYEINDNLLKGEIVELKNIEIVTDPETGKRAILGLTKKQREEFYDKSDKQLFEEAEKRYKEHKESNSFLGKIKGVFQNTKNNIFSKKNEKKEESQNNENNQVDDNINEDNEEITLNKNEDGSYNVTENEETNTRLNKIFNDDSEYTLESALTELSGIEEEIDDVSEDKPFITKNDLKEFLNNNKEYESFLSGRNVDDILKNNRSASSLVKKINKAIEEENNNNSFIKQIKELEKESPERIKAILEEAEKNKDFSFNETVLGKALLDGTLTKEDIVELYTSKTKFNKSNNQNRGRKFIGKTKKIIQKRKEKKEQKRKISIEKIREKLELEEQIKASTKNRSDFSIRKKLLKYNDSNVEITSNEVDNYLNGSIGEFHYDPGVKLKASVLNFYLKKAFPDKNISVFTFKNLMNALEVDAFGYALGSTIMIDEKLWNQDEIYMHEISHILYNVTEDHPETKAFINEAKNNKDLLENIEERYYSDIVYLNTELNENSPYYAMTYQQLVENQAGKTYEEKEAAALYLINQGAYKKAPFEYQFIIQEELFTHSLQGPLSKMYNKYFDPNLEYLRQEKSTEWWAYIKDSFKTVIDPYHVIETLNNGTVPNINNTKDYIIDNFVKNLNKSPLKSTVNGRYMRSSVKRKNDLLGRSNSTNLKEFSINTERNKQKEIQKNTERIDKAFYDSLNKEVVFTTEISVNEQIKKIKESLSKKKNPKLLLEELFSVFNPEPLDKNGKTSKTAIFKQLKRNEITLDEMQKSFFDASFEKAELKLGALFSLYVKEYNKAAYANAKEQNKFFISEAIKNKLVSGIRNIAKSTESPAEFLYELENSRNKNIKTFLNFLKERFDESEYINRISSAYLLYSNQTTLPGVVNEVFLGKHNLNEKLSKVEEMMIKSAQNAFIKDSSQRKLNEIYNEFKKNKSIDEKEAIAVLRILSGNNTPINEIIKNNYLIYNKKMLPLTEAVNNIFKNNDFNGVKNEIIKTLYYSGKEFSAFDTVLNTNGNNVANRVLDSSLTRTIAEVQTALKNDISLSEFIKRFGNQNYINAVANNNFKQDSNLKKVLKNKEFNTNSLLEFWYDNYKATGEIPYLSLNTGVFNQDTLIGNEPKNQDYFESILSDFLNYINNLGNKNYDGSIGILGDSSKDILTSLPSIKYIDIENGNLTTSGKEKLYGAYLKSLALEIDKGVKNYYNQNKQVGYDEFLNAINKDAEAMTEDLLINRENLEKIKQLNPLFENKRILNNFVKNYIINKVVNGLNIHQIFYPGIPLESKGKRSKTIASPNMALDKNLRLEIIPWARQFKKYTRKNRDTDVAYKEKIIEQNDSGQYILEKHALMIEKAGYGSIDFGKGYKLFMHGIEDQNAKYKNQSIILKGYTTILSHKDVYGPNATQPELAPIYELLMKRDEKFMEWYENSPNGKEKNGEYVESFSTGQLKYLPIVCPLTAIKANLFEESEIESINNIVSLEAMSTERGLERANELVDLFNYSENEFIGFNGSNLGPQQVMDKYYNEANFGVQIASSSIMAENTSEEELQNAENIIEELYKQKEANLQEYILNEITNPLNGEIDPKKVKEFILQTIDPNEADMDFLYNLVQDYTTSYTPYQDSDITNHIKQQFIKYGNRIQVKGTYGQTISDIGYSHRYDGKKIKVNGNNHLNFYEYEVVKGKKKIKPMEIILPSGSYNDFRKRELFKLSPEDVANIIFENKKLLNEFELTTKEEVIEFVKQHEFRNNKNEIEGYYIPGQKVMITRIPHNSPSFLGIAEVIGFGQTGASTIQVPSQFKNIIGADDDGDAIFVYSKSDNIKFNHWNNAFDGILKAWSDPKMINTLTTSLEFENEIDEVILEILSILKQDYTYFDLLAENEDNLEKFKNNPEELKKIKKEYQKNLRELKQKLEGYKVPYGYNDFKDTYNNTRAAKQTLGIGFNTHRILNLLSAYNVKLNVPKGFSITARIDEENGSVYLDEYNDDFTFKDSRKGSGTSGRIFKNTIITNIVLDSAKNNHANPLNLNIHTISTALVMSNLGFTIKEIGLFLNHPVTKLWTQKMSTKKSPYLDTESKKQIISELSYEFGVRTKDIYMMNSVDMIIDPAINGYESNENNTEVLKFLNFMEGINSEMAMISNLLSGHKDLESNPLNLDKKTKKIKNLLLNKDINQKLSFPTRFINNPEIKAYLNTDEKWNEVNKMMHISYNDQTIQLLDELKNKITSNDMTDKQTLEYQDLVKRFIYSRVVGLNNVQGFHKYIDFMSDNNLYDDIYNHINKLKKEIYFDNEGNQITGLNKSILFSELLSNDESGLKLSKKNIINYDMIQQAKKEFSKLPAELQEKIIFADLLRTNWDKKNFNDSLFPIIPDEIIDEITERLTLIHNKVNTINDVTKKTLIDTIVNAELNKEVNNFKKVYLNNFKFNEKDTNTFFKAIAPAILDSDKDLVQRIRDGVSDAFIEVVVREDKKTSPKKIIVKVNKIDQNQLNQIQRKEASIRESNKQSSLTAMKIDMQTNNSSTLALFANNFLKNQLEIIPQKPISNNDDYDYFIKEISFIPDNSTKKLENIKNTGRYYRIDYNNFTSKKELSPYEYKESMQWDIDINSEEFINAYNKYLVDKKDANRIYDSFYSDPNAFVNLSDKKLIDIYEKYGIEDAYAYSIIIVPALIEMAKRSSQEQSEITGRYENGKDISPLKSYLQANNIDSNHPATQYIARNIEVQYNEFKKERSNYLKRINKVTNDLYKEKYGFKATNNSLWNNVKLTALALFKNRKKVYEHLYDNLVVKELFIHEGNPVQRLRMKSLNELKEQLNKKEISEAEYNYAKEYQAIINELHPNKKGYQLEGFVPMIGMNNYESFANRGLLGLLTNSKPIEQKMWDVVLNYKGEKLTFKEIEDQYRHTNANNLSNAKDYLLYRRKAYKLSKKGINEDGSKIQSSNIQNLTMLGDGMMNRFANHDFVHVNDLVSLDLNRAITEFVHTTLFVNGNQNFAGFKKLQASVDALLIHNRTRGFSNQNAYVQKVYKEYFLKGMKHDPDKPFDKVTDLLVKGNFYYVMGWKLAVVGKGLYAVGNVVAGKYHNIKNAGGSNWLKGESRFWGLNTTGNFGTEKARNVLNNLGFMNIDISDEVELNTSSGLDSIISRIALMPMTSSENWIQSVHFLGLLTDEQWDKFDDKGNYKPDATPISSEEITILEGKVKDSHGRGYTPVDQRLIQRYSWGRMLMQFSRFVPTMFNDRFAKKDIDIYGNEKIGSLRAVYDMVKLVISGNLKPSEINAYKNSLSKSEKEAFEAGLRGMAMTTLAAFVAVSFGNELAADLVGDANYAINPEKLEYKMVPSVVRNIHGAFF